MMPKRILAADDSRTIRTAISVTFDKEPAVELLLAANGNEALDILRREPVDLLLLDYQMPDISGTALCARLKQEPQLKHIPILLLTGRNYDPSQTRKLGADGAIPKPFLSSQLIKRAADILAFPYTPAPLSIAEEMGDRRPESIEIDIDLGLDAPAPAMPAASTAPLPSLPVGEVKPFAPSMRPGPPPPSQGRTATAGHTPMLMPEKELPFHGSSGAPSPAFPRPGTSDMIIDDLPPEPGAAAKRPGSAPGTPPFGGRTGSRFDLPGARAATPAGSQALGSMPQGLPDLPPLGTAPTPLAPSQSALSAVPKQPLAMPKAAQDDDDELEVLVGKPVEVGPPLPSLQSDPEELILPMEDEPSPPAPTTRYSSAPPPLQKAPKTHANKGIPPTTPGTLVPQASPLAAPGASKDILREGSYLKTSNTQPAGKPAPTPLPPFAPKEPPKRPKNRMSPQATQKFRMVDLLGENQLPGSTAAPDAPSVVSVDSLLPTSEVETISSIAEDAAEATPSASAEVTRADAKVPPGLESLLSTEPPDLSSAALPDRFDSNPFESMTGPAPSLSDTQASELPTSVEETKTTDDAPAAVVVGLLPERESTQVKPSPRLTETVQVEDDMPFDAPLEEDDDEEGSSIRVQAPDFSKLAAHPAIESAASFSMEVETPAAPCPPGQLQLRLDAALNLRELAWLLQFAEYASQLLETRLNSAPEVPIFVNSQRHQGSTTLTFGGEMPHLAMTVAMFLECWPNLQDEDKESLHKALLERLSDKKRPKLKRLLGRLNIDIRPYVQALRNALPLLQDTALEQCISGLSTPAVTLFEDDGISSMVVEEPLQEERNALVEALQGALDLPALGVLLRDEFSLELNEIVSPGLPAASIYLAVIYHFELRFQLPDLAECVKEQRPSADGFDVDLFSKYPGN